MAHMSLFRAALRPALPPPGLNADVYETAGGGSTVLEHLDEVGVRASR